MDLSNPPDKTTTSHPGLSQRVGMMLLEAEEVELLDVAGQKVEWTQ